MKQFKICGIITKAFGVRAFMLENLKYLTENGNFKSSFICERYEGFTEEELFGLKYIPIDMNRGNVSIGEVLRCIKTMYKIFVKERFDIIQFASSNAGLYASIAGFMARVPVRVYCQWGISYTDYSGLKRIFYKFAEKITCVFATNVQPDSKANLKFAIEEGLYSAKKGNVIHEGSANGVNLHKYNLDKKTEWRNQIREELNISEDKRVFGFVGRLVPEKGINELFEAFMATAREDDSLLVVGPEYEVDRLDQDLYKKAKTNNRIIFVGEKRDTAPYYSAMDFLVLPSYREGFGSVILEAAALKVPVICSNIKGPTDLVKDGYNGIICDVQSPESLKSAFKRVQNLTSKSILILADNAYKEVREKFDADIFRKYYLKDRLELLEHHNII